LYFGTNRKEKVVVPSIFAFMIDGFEDLMLKILLVAGGVSIVLEMIFHADKRNIAWVEGFAIIFAVLLVVTVTAVNDRNKELEF